MAKKLTLEEILSAHDLVEKTVSVPEWGGEVVVRGFSKAKQQALRREATDAEGNLDSDKVEMLMFCYGIVDPEISSESYLALRDKNAGAIDRVLKEILAISGLGPEALAEAQSQFPKRPEPKV